MALRSILSLMAAGNRLTNRRGDYIPHFQAGIPVFALVSFREIQGRFRKPMSYFSLSKLCIFTETLILLD
jgi:hypothetical protein